MSTTREDIQRWIEYGKEKKATHLIVVCDTFDWEDYPVYVSATEDVHTVKAEHSINMQRVMEVYNLLGDTNSQLNEDRSFNY